MNSAEFEHFKLHADSTLKGMAKDELISYIHMLHHNWSCADEQLCNVMNNHEELFNTLKRENNVLKSALDKACEQLAGFDHFMYENGYERVENWNKDEWKEDLMKDVD